MIPSNHMVPTKKIFRLQQVKNLLLIGIIISTACASLSSQFAVSSLFSDHMVIQRSQPITIWGEGNPGSEINVRFNGRNQSGYVDSDGKWSIELPSMKEGGPYELAATQNDEKIKIVDVYIGDVWICSGQSNMEWTVALSDGMTEAKQEADDPLIRHLKVAHSYADKPDPQLIEGYWEVAGPETIADFTAVGYYFARELRKHTGVPIGLINTSWGGSRIEAWMSAEALGFSDPESTISSFRQREQFQQKEILKELASKFPGLSETDMGMKGKDAIWSSAGLDETKWTPIDVPGQWEQQGYEGFDGIGWYRIHFNIAEDIVKDDAMVSLGKIDDSDQVWLNGQYIGGMQQAWNETRKYEISSNLLRKGDNVIAIRVEDTGGGGGIHGDMEELFLILGNERLSLAGNAMFRPGAIMKPNLNANVHHTPTLLYNKMIYPLFRYPIKGAIWYQGESNAESKKDAEAYADQFKSMISDWRSKWKVGNFPFLYVQLANFMSPPSEPGESNWAALRASQRKALELDDVGEAVIIDIGEADDIHPRNKKDVGYRLSLEARRIAYGENIISYGPQPVEYEWTEGTIVITFDQALIVRDKYGYVKGLDVELRDGKKYWAAGLVEDNLLQIFHPLITNVKSVRYGWADNPDDVNLYNDQGLPVSPFKINILK